MKLSTQGRHAIMSMLALALHDEESALRLHDLAEQQAISLSYLEQIFAKLRRAGLVEGMRGPGGGYRLGKAPAHISIAAVVRAVEDKPPMSLHWQLQHEGAAHVPFAQKIWEDLSAQLYVFLEGLTLDGLIGERQRPRKTYRLGSTAGLIAGMFPAHATKTRPNQSIGM